MRTQSAEKKKMRILNQRERQIAERKLNTRICPLTAIVKESISRGIFPGDETLKAYRCGRDGGTARHGQQSEVVGSAAITPCPLGAAENCEVYLAHLGYRVENV
jgi:hypothetical protein